MSTTNPISSLSYTSKDFQTIYPELLDLVKKLTYKWDPSVSNESDPGVILLKLNAIIADKNNYNIDKNILEAFPLSVTQNSNARQLYEQLGYNMAWYNSATTLIALKWSGELSEDSITIPMFTMVSDGENNLIYTLLGNTSSTVDILNASNVNLSDFIGNITVPRDGSTVNVVAIQGVIHDYTINGNSLITLDKLDSNNRLYFYESNVAENGIFIQGASERVSTEKRGNFSDWSKVDNLATADTYDKVYKFGVTSNPEMCYIEFSDNIDELITDGIYISYVTSDGAEGNTIARTIQQFYSASSVADPNSNSKKITLSSDNTVLSNLNAVSNGSDPESIDDAYKNYKRTVGTFNTLVTLRDYINTVISSGLVSNAFVCDRTNDIQNSYNIIIDSDVLIPQYTQVKQVNSVDVMGAFDLKMYLLQYVDDTSTSASYKKSFDVANSNALNTTVYSYIDDVKSIQHNFLDIEEDTYCLFKNKYSIKCRIIPQYELILLQASEVKANICAALYKNLSSKSLEFGQQISYDDILDVIKNADERVKSVILDDIVYDTYAVYFDGTNYVEVKVSELDSVLENKSKEFRKDIYAKSVLAGRTQLLIPDENYRYGIDQTYSLEQNNIKNIDTSTVVGEDFDAHDLYEIRLKQNECVRLYAPNLQDILTFLYVDYIYKFSNTAPANSDYALRNDDYIIFMTKSDNEQFYTYYKYGAGTIIRPNFEMSGNNEISGISSSSFTAGKHKVTDSALNDAISNISSTSTNNALSATKQVVVRDYIKNTFGGTSMPNNYCYWVLNKSVTDTSANELYELFASATIPTSTTPDIYSQEYILKSGEYFIRTNSAKTELEILGAGTRIVRTSETSMDAWTVKKLDLSKTSITELGLSAFQDSDWKNIDGRKYTVEVTEMQSVNIQDEAWLKVTKKEGVLSEGLYFKSSGAFKKTTSLENEVILSEASLSDYTIEYKLNDATEYVPLPIINVSNDGWKAKSILNISISPDVPQPLLENQKIAYGDNEGDVIIGGANVLLLSNMAIEAEGGTGIDTTSIDLNGNTHYMSLYKYAGYENSTSESYQLDDTDKFFTVKLDKTTPPELIFNLPSGMYLIPVSHMNTDLSSLTLSIRENEDEDGYMELNPVNNSESSELKSSGKYYLVADLSSANATTKFTVKVTSDYASDDDKVIRIGKVFKYTEGLDLPADIPYSDVLAQVVLLDLNKKFNYTHTVTDELLIKNPLDGTSFNNQNHIFNKYTINQISDITVLIASRSR